ncbi:Autonomous glycyl radical cofactor [Morganella morganii]|nr:Autonomous glycyl radical cofactor [Morganella morganii]
MVTGIQITKSENAALVNSFWLLDDSKDEVRCICAKEQYADGDVVSRGRIRSFRVPRSEFTGSAYRPC